MIPEILWERLEPLLPKLKRRRDRRGRPWTGDREIMEAIFWILRTGAQWRELPAKYPPRSTVHRRFQMLVKKEFFRNLTRELANELRNAGVVNLEECFVDGTFASAKKGVTMLARQGAARARK